MSQSPRTPPLFLRRASYRQRRRRDAARLLPVVGLFLMLLPVLWAPQDTFRRDTAPDGIYLFVIWAVLIALAMLVSRSLNTADEADDADASPDPGQGT
ncbi:MAG: hypothetical protein U0934_17635 [Pseudotabrizicola sp.]|uniref:hypothetical protein n=1 Tax=Pseudotabrizicola sp. TaxID=2939647 RepID=UPI002715D4B5|nr:hypothetical protein [Pseudotabrizicola sp.]MDO8881600.1 hypothetical protein [Pseudotabrizicola sp.]MDP2081544.1 hypothetical protein [Pseudotabrizicola sp.]MDZ7575747.1 hypothetical protein [Pseudotabrizicola sp.]